MKRIAMLFLASGIIIIILAVGVAVSAMTSPANGIQFEPAAGVSDTCLFCHIDAHDNWKLINTPDLDKASSSTLQPLSQSAITPAQDQMCGNCHSQTGQKQLPADEIQSNIESVQERVAGLRADLDRIFDHYAAIWDLSAYMSDKPAQQIAAERISTLVAVIEADGSWGFHNPDYTEEILTEAETLMEQLLNDLR